MCRRGLQTLTLFETKSVHFATLFKIRDVYILLVFCIFCLPCFSFPIQKVFFLINDIIELDFKKLLVPTCRIQGFQYRKTPCARRKTLKTILLSGTYPFSPNKGVSPRDFLDQNTPSSGLTPLAHLVSFLVASYSSQRSLTP